MNNLNNVVDIAFHFKESSLYLFPSPDRGKKNENYHTINMYSDKIESTTGLEVSPLSSSLDPIDSGNRDFRKIIFLLSGLVKTIGSLSFSR